MKKNLLLSLRYLVLILISFVFIFPILFMIVSSFKPDLQLLRDTSSLRAFLPVGDISWDNYQEAFERAPIGRFIFNSLFISTTTVAIGLLINSMAGFSFAVLNWKGKRFILAIIIATFIVPFETIMIPLLLEVNQFPWLGFQGFTIGWLNTYHVQIIPFLAHSFQIFLFYQFFKSIPSELVDAAHIDGAAWFRIYWSVAIPISGPILATATILRFLEMWNQYVWPLMVIRTERFRPVMVGLTYFFQLNTAWGEIMAYLTIVAVPVLVVFIALQRAFIESIAASGIKG